MSQGGSLSSSGGGGGSVNSVSGTANRITSTGGANPVIDISAAYVGQTSITTLGTLTTGTWNATAISETNGGTNQTTYSSGQILYASAANTLSKLSVGTSGQVLTVSGGLPSWATPAASGVTSVSGTANRISSTGGNTPVIDIDAAYVGQATITTLGTIGTGTWEGTTVAVNHGGTGATTLTGVLTGNGTSAITANTVTQNGVLYGGASNAVSSTATGSSGQVLQSAGASAPVYSTATFPSTATGTGKILRADGTNWVATTSTYPATNNSGDLIYGSAGSAYSNLGVGSNGQVLTVASSLPSWASPAWVLVETQTASTSSTIDFTTISSSYRIMKIIITNIHMGGGGLVMRVSTDGGSTYISSGYAWVSQLYRSDGATDFGRSNSDSFMNMNRTSGSAPQILQTELNLYNINSGTNYFAVQGNLSTYDGSGTGFTLFTGSYITATAVNAVRFLSSSGSTIDLGTFALYGIN